MNVATITIFACPADDLDSFEQMTSEERRRRSRGWKSFPVRSGCMPDTFVMKATHHDFGVFASEDESCMIDKDTLLDVLPVLQRLVEEEPGETAHLLHVHGGATGDLARITAALKTGAWPERDDFAEEAAAFAHQLLVYGRHAEDAQMGVCWEYDGEVRALLPPPPTDRTRELEALYERMRRASAGMAHADLWEHGGKASATAEQIVAHDAFLAATMREHAAAKAALETLVAKLRAEAPHEVDAWAFAHYCYISQFLHECAERQDDNDSTRIAHATREREEWAAVRAGTRPFVEGASWVPLNAYFYRAYFG